MGRADASGPSVPRQAAAHVLADRAFLSPLRRQPRGGSTGSRAVRASHHSARLPARPAEHRRARRLLGRDVALRGAGVRRHRAVIATRRPINAMRHNIDAVRVRIGANGTVETRLVDSRGDCLGVRFPHQGADRRGAAVRAAVGLLAACQGNTGSANSSAALPALLRDRDRHQLALVRGDLPARTRVPEALLLGTQRAALLAAVRSLATGVVLRAEYCSWECSPARCCSCRTFAT